MLTKIEVKKELEKGKTVNHILKDAKYAIVLDGDNFRFSNSAIPAVIYWALHSHAMFDNGWFIVAE